ncbi:chaplin [Streptomyces sp. NBC_00576]|uniref:chaplin n=1 Tax=Streptomyces sp. NBC_00576 TaxID=2903665 RepID=UPI002E80DBE6|nr:chaplin [Streptomyces sp. NBC_00576]WUB74306.1 chaplin [Streptomyces sp. NBC_00576]
MSRIAKAAVAALGTGAVVLGGAGMATADADAQAAAIGSPGVLSGNVLQVPVHIPVNVCGNTINLVGLLNPAFGNTCANVSGHHHKGNPGPDHHQGNPGPGGYGN